MLKVYDKVGAEGILPLTGTRGSPGTVHLEESGSSQGGTGVCNETVDNGSG